MAIANPAPTIKQYNGVITGFREVGRMLINTNPVHTPIAHESRETLTNGTSDSKPTRRFS